MKTCIQRKTVLDATLQPVLIKMHRKSFFCVRNHTNSSVKSGLSVLTNKMAASTSAVNCYSIVFTNRPLSGLNLKCSIELEFYVL